MSNDTKFTPGPWHVSDDLDTVIGPKGNVVAECKGYSVQASDPAQQLQGGREANAALISAAPDLYAALQGLYSLCPPGHLNDDRGLWANARAALAKAGGQ